MVDSCLLQNIITLDTIAAVTLHPLEPKLVSVSGSRHFDDEHPQHEDISDEESSDSSHSSSSINHKMARPRSLNPISRDTSIKLWRFPSRSVNLEATYSATYVESEMYSTDPWNPQA